PVVGAPEGQWGAAEAAVGTPGVVGRTGGGSGADRGAVDPGAVTRRAADGWRIRRGGKCRRVNVPLRGASGRGTAAFSSGRCRSTSWSWPGWPTVPGTPPGRAHGSYHGAVPGRPAHADFFRWTCRGPAVCGSAACCSGC